MAAQNKLPQVEVPPRIRNAEGFTDQQGLAMFYNALDRQTKTPADAVLLPLLLRGPFPLIPSLDTSHGSKSKKSSGKAGLGSGSGSGSGSGALWRKNLAAVLPEEEHSILLSLIRNEIAALLGYQGQELPDKPFFDLGFDSFTSVILTNKLRVVTGLDSLPVTLALDYDTPQTLVQHLLPRIKAELEPEIGFDDDASATSENTNSTDSDDSREKPNSSSTSSTFAPDDQNDTNNMRVSPSTFHGMSTIHRRLALLEQYTAAQTLLASASLAMPIFPKAGPSLSSYATPPQRLATGPPSSSLNQPPIIFTSPLSPRIKIEGTPLSVYSNLSHSISPQRGVFELPHPELEAVPQDLDTLAELHLPTIREFF